MDHSYTELITDKYLDLTDKEIYKIWENIENSSEEMTAKEWQKKIVKIAKEYCYSSRYFLIRFLKEDLNIKDAMHLSQDELNRIQNKLEKIAIEKNANISNEETNLIQKALGQSIKENILTREEAFKLGHLLGFDLMTMQQYLLRVLENEDGFNFKYSNDLIEAYGFLTNKTSHEVEELKVAYEESTSFIKKVLDDHYNTNFTKELETSLISMVDQWSVETGSNEEEMDSEFINWMVEKAPYLDFPSRTALRVYRNLTAFIYEIVVNNKDVPTQDELYTVLNDVMNQPEESDAAHQLFYDGKKISVEKCKEVANKLSEYHVWNTLHVKEDGKPHSKVQENRVGDILAMASDAPIQMAPQKSDILYLLWFIEDMCWSIDEEKTPDRIFNQIADMLDIARECLQITMLPDFYPPHVLEQAMFLSVIGLQDGQSPNEVYEDICKGVNGTKVKEKGVKHKAKAQKGEIVKQLIGTGIEIKDLSELCGVSDKSLYAWRDDIIQKLIENNIDDTKEDVLYKKYGITLMELKAQKDEMEECLKNEDFDTLSKKYGVKKKLFHKLLDTYKKMHTQ